MRKFTGQTIGIDQGDVVLFSDFEDDGEMWTGEGARVCRRRVNFSDRFMSVPLVTVSLSMLDVSNAANLRTDIVAENIRNDGFEIVFRTWGDSRIARVRVFWQAIGEMAHDDSWNL